MRTIDTGMLTLEPQTAAHAEAMFVVLSDPAIYLHENEPPESLDWLRTRFTRLETRRSGDGTEQWLNWVIRLPEGELIGYVQASVPPDGCAGIAYVLGSAHWGRGHARRAVEAMLVELASHHRARRFAAVLKRSNVRSMRLLERLGFTPGTPAQHAAHEALPDEALMLRGLHGR